MARTTSISFPNMIDVVSNKISICVDDESIVNRSRLLMLTSPTELYNNPNFGVGLTKYIWQYNTENTKARLKDNIIEQLRKYEPCVNADDTQFEDGLLYTEGGESSSALDANRLKMTVGLSSIYGDKLEVNLNDVPSSSSASNYVPSKSGEYMIPHAVVRYTEFQSDWLRGDINGDGVIDSADEELIRDFLSDEVELVGWNYLAADINNDGVVDNTDLLLLRRYLSDPVAYPIYPKYV